MRNTREKAATSLGKIQDTKFSQKEGMVYIFPFVIRNGYVNITENGFVDKGASPSNFSFFQKVFTGTETITATWKNSTQLNVRDATKGTYNYDFKVGDYVLGQPVVGSENRRIEISDVNGNEDFMAMQSAGEVTIMFSQNSQGRGDNGNAKLSENDVFNLYIIPEIFGNQWLYISNWTSYPDPQNRKILLSEVTFSILKDALEKSGRALEQYVQYAAPGEPYAFPYIVEGPHYREVQLSPFTTRPEPVKYLQLEIQGGSALSSPLVLGRKLYWDNENKKWYTSPGKFLFPAKMLNPQANPLNKTAAPSKSFFFFPDEEVDVRNTKEWLQAVKEQNQVVAPVQNMGAYTMGTASNWDNTNKQHASNLKTNGLFNDFNNLSWKPTPHNIAMGYTDIGDAGYNGWRTKSLKGNPYTTDSMYYAPTDNMMQILIKNSMLNMQQLELPLSFTSSRPYRWSNIPVIGFWTRWFGDRAMFPNTTNVKNSRLGYFIDCNLAIMAREYFEQPKQDTQKNYANLQQFLGQETPATLNPQATNTTLCFELTDKVSFTDNKYTGSVGQMSDGIDTVYLSQIKDENGNFLHNDRTPLLLNCNDGNLIPRIVGSEEGFVIDNVIVWALFIGKEKISCYGKYTNNNLSNPLFTQTVMSSSMFEQNNIRNWTTNLTLGTWDSNWSNGEITWPLAPQKEQTSYEKIIEYKGLNFESQAKYGAPGWKLYPKTKGPFNFLRDKATSQALNEMQLGYDQPTPDLYEFTYHEFGCNTKQEFINKFSTIQFSLEGTVLNLHCYDIFYDKEWNCPINDKRIIININDIAPTYHRTFSLGALNCSHNYPLAPIIQKDGMAEYIGLYVFTFRGEPGEYTTDGGWSQDVDVDISLLDDKITISLKERTIFYGYKYIAEAYDLRSDGWIGVTCLPVTAFNQRKAHLRSQISIPKIIFTLKQEV